MKSSWFEAGYLKDVNESLHERISLTLDLTTLCLIENSEVFKPILFSSVDLVKKSFVAFPRLQNDVGTVINLMYDYLYFYCKHVNVGVDDVVIIDEFIKEYKKKLLN